MWRSLVLPQHIYCAQWKDSSKIIEDSRSEVTKDIGKILSSRKLATEFIRLAQDKGSLEDLGTLASAPALESCSVSIQ